VPRVSVSVGVGVGVHVDINILVSALERADNLLPKAPCMPQWIYSNRQAERYAEHKMD
jgi:hypothetical protein